MKSSLQTTVQDFFIINVQLKPKNVTCCQPLDVNDVLGFYEFSNCVRRFLKRTTIHKIFTNVFVFVSVDKEARHTMLNFRCLCSGKLAIRFVAMWPKSLQCSP